MTVRFWLLLGTFAIGMHVVSGDEFKVPIQEAEEAGASDETAATANVADTEEAESTDWKPKLLIILQTDEKPASQEQKEVRVPAYLPERDARQREPAQVSTIGWENATVQITKVNLIHVFCDQADLAISGTSETPTYKLKCDGPMFVEKSGVRINCESGTYEDGQLKLTNVRINMVDSEMTAAEFAISVPQVFSAHTEPFNQSLENWTPAFCRLNVAPLPMIDGEPVGDWNSNSRRTAIKPVPDPGVQAFDNEQTSPKSSDEGRFFNRERAPIPDNQPENETPDDRSQRDSSFSRT